VRQVLRDALAGATAQNRQVALRELRPVARQSARRCRLDAQQSDEFVVPRMARQRAAPADAAAMDLVCRFRAIASLLIS
jgi:hypothetical protein